MSEISLQELDRCSLVSWYYDIHDQLRAHVYARSAACFARGRDARERISSRVEWQGHRDRLRATLLASLGGLPTSADSLRLESGERLETAEFVVEKILFESRENVWIPALLYLPQSLTQSVPAVLVLSGHSEQGKSAESQQRICQALARSGLIAFAPDPLGQGERSGYVDEETGSLRIARGTPEHNHAGMQCLPLGDGLARYFLHDAIRALDVLAARPEVDSSRLGVTGESGGGMLTSLLMAVDPRVAAAAPASFLTSREAYLLTGIAQDAEQIWFGFSQAGFDHADLLLAMAPRPVLVLAALSDSFPIEGTRDSVLAARAVLRRANLPGTIELFEDQAPHGFSPAMIDEAVAFFRRQLLGCERMAAGSFAPWPAVRLQCTRSGHIGRDFPRARFVFDENQDRLTLRQSERNIASGLAWLRERVFFGRTECPLNPRFFQSASFDGLGLDFAFWWSQPGLLNHGVMIRPLSRTDEKLPVTMAIWDGGTEALADHLDEIRALAIQGRAVFVVDLSGCGSIRCRPLSPYDPDEFDGAMHKLADDLAWIGDDLAALRTYDVLRAAQVLKEWPQIDAENIRLYGQGQHGIYARLAAPLHDQVREVVWQDGFFSYAEFVRSRHYRSKGIRPLLLWQALQHFDLSDLPQPMAVGPAD